VNRIKEVSIHMAYDKDKMNMVYAKVKQLNTIVNELEAEFEGRKFTLDGHLLGSIGEVLAAYYYGIELSPTSTKAHDAITQDGRNVQIKITQTNSISLKYEPEYLIVFYLNKKTGEISEVYNGPGKQPWNYSYFDEEHNNHKMKLPTLIQQDVQVQDRIGQVNFIPKYSNFKETTKAKTNTYCKDKEPESIKKGFINDNNQINLGKTDMKGTDHGQMFYQMECLTCHYQYLSNGTNIKARICPIGKKKHSYQNKDFI
jgi:hypothetical protein